MDLSTIKYSLTLLSYSNILRSNYLFNFLSYFFFSKIANEPRLKALPWSLSFCKTIMTWDGFVVWGYDLWFGALNSWVLDVGFGVLIWDLGFLICGFLIWDLGFLICSGFCSYFGLCSSHGLCIMFFIWVLGVVLTFVEWRCLQRKQNCVFDDF